MSEEKIEKGNISKFSELFQNEKDFHSCINPVNEIKGDKEKIFLKDSLNETNKGEEGEKDEDDLNSKSLDFNMNPFNSDEGEMEDDEDVLIFEEKNKDIKKDNFDLDLFPLNNSKNNEKLLNEDEKKVTNNKNMNENNNDKDYNIISNSCGNSRNIPRLFPKPKISSFDINSQIFLPSFSGRNLNINSIQDKGIPNKMKSYENFTCIKNENDNKQVKVTKLNSNYPNNILNCFSLENRGFNSLNSNTNSINVNNNSNRNNALQAQVNQINNCFTMNGKPGWICFGCKNFNYEGKFLYNI